MLSQGLVLARSPLDFRIECRLTQALGTLQRKVPFVAKDNSRPCPKYTLCLAVKDDEQKG